MQPARSGVAVGPGANPVLLGQQVLGSPIRHVIVLVQENRTFDNLFASSIVAHGGPFPGANTSQTATVDGKRIALKPVPFENPARPEPLSHLAAARVGRRSHGRLRQRRTARGARRAQTAAPVFPTPTFPPTKRPSTTCWRRATRSPMKTSRRAWCRRSRVTTRWRRRRAASREIPTMRSGAATPNRARRFRSLAKAKR